MATTIELDIIKQRSDKLNAIEKQELIAYLKASLASEENGRNFEIVDNISGDIADTTNDESKIA